MTEENDVKKVFEDMLEKSLEGMSKDTEDILKHQNKNMIPVRNLCMILLGRELVELMSEYEKTTEVPIDEARRDRCLKDIKLILEVKSLLVEENERAKEDRNGR